MVSVTQQPPTSRLASLVLARRPTHTQRHAWWPGPQRGSQDVCSLARVQGQRTSDREASSQDWLLEVFPEFWAPPPSVAFLRGVSEGLEPP